MDVLKTVHQLGLDLVYRSTSFSEFVKVYNVIGNGDWWGVKIDPPLEDFEIDWLAKKGFFVPRPDIIISPGIHPVDFPLEVLEKRHRVFYLTRQNKAIASFALLLQPEGIILEGIEGNELYRLRRGTPDFSIDENGFERGKVPDWLRKLWAVAHLIDVGCIIVVEGFLYEDGRISVYEVECVQRKY